MKYLCENGHKFIHPEILEKVIKWGHVGVTLATNSILDAPEETSTIHVCPFCHSLKFDDYIEPQPDITSVKSVDLSLVDEYLKQGYIVHELYAKSATLKKVSFPCEAPATEPLPPPPLTYATDEQCMKEEQPTATITLSPEDKQAEDAYTKLDKQIKSAKALKDAKVEL